MKAADTVIYEKSDSTWGAYVPDLPSVIAAGDSREEVESLMREAVEFHIEGLRAEGLAVPPLPVGRACSTSLLRSCAQVAAMAPIIKFFDPNPATGSMA
ncbi:MAG: type II toxin-antitoxin system HicB family antitoxin [Acidobacteria bacterium]|nr:type II toxin-antitoxin system HicB family antitoxin [Acidobacteriota bacterium]